MEYNQRNTGNKYAELKTTKEDSGLRVKYLVCPPFTPNVCYGPLTVNWKNADIQD